MLRKKIKKLLLVSATLCLGFLISCSGEEKSSEHQNTEGGLSNLENDTFYILHSDNSMEKLLSCESTFGMDGNVPEAPSNDRIIWMQEDTYNQIPTIYSDDKLIYYTTNIINEEFTYERFENLGYSVGLRDLTLTKSGRYCISTVNEANTVYPLSDTNQLLNFENELVILEEFGGQKLRAARDKESGEFVPDSQLFSRCGTIVNLEKDKQYGAKVFSGTEEYNFDFKADVLILGSMEETRTIDYEFESKTIANIHIPEYFNSGYYTLNNVGLFRYVKGKSFDEKTDFNIRNIPAADTMNIDMSIYDTDEDGNSTGQIALTDEQIYDKDGYYGDSKSSFRIEEEGTYTVTVNITMDETIYESDKEEPTTAFIVNPDRTKKFTLTGNEKKLTAVITGEIGKYDVYYSNTKNRKLELTIDKIG